METTMLWIRNIKAASIDPSIMLPTAIGLDPDNGKATAEYWDGTSETYPSIAVLAEEHKISGSLRLDKFCDPVEDYREGVSLEVAREVYREDPGLLLLVQVD